MGLVVIRLAAAAAAAGDSPRALYNVLLTCPAVMLSLSLSLHSKSHQAYLNILCVCGSVHFSSVKKKPVYSRTVLCYCELRVTRQ
jgi:hypothetical protein